MLASRLVGLASRFAQGVQTRVHRHLLDPWQDRRLAIDASGRHVPSELSLTGRNAQYARDYYGSPSWVVDRALDSLNIDVSQFVFVDLGCGKGRVMLRAAKRPFRRIEGVELSEPMHGIALKNIEQARMAGSVRAPVVAHCSDVTAYRFPTEPLVLYVFHAFGPAVLRPLLENLEASLRAQPRACYFIYLNPAHQDQFVHCPSLQEMPRARRAKLLDALISPWPLTTYGTRPLSKDQRDGACAQGLAPLTVR
jgi:SAM-dependent methyltransferase